MLVTETFHGYIETTQDVLLIFEGCRRGLLPRICRRLQERERKMIRSGSIFVFDERESGIKRWTDGRVWSPSRILGNFLIYRELDKKSNNEKKMSVSSTGSNNSNNNNVMMLNNNNSSSEASRRSFSIDSSISIDRNKERQLVGSLSDSYRFKEDGLIKKTMSIIVNGVAQHLISYYDPNEVLQEKLRAPSSVPELASLEISPELLVKQNFRIPPLVEPTFDQQGQLTPPEQQQQQQSNRLMHPLRSMSVGSLRGQHPGDMIQQQQQQQTHLMYHASPYSNNPNTTNSTRPHSPNNFHQPLSIPNNVYTTNNNSQMPSPSSLSSSPSTPMLSPARQSYQQQQHQRHYSASSISSNSLPRFDPRNYSAPSANTESSSFTNNNTASSTNSHDRQHHQQQHLPTDGFGSNERFTSPPNLGQLLNPIHPLNNNNNNSNPNSDLLHSIGMTSHHHGYEYNNNTNGSSSLRNSISSQHEDSKPTPTPTSSTPNDHNTSPTVGGSNTSGSNSVAGGGGGGGGGGMPDYMHYYQRQPLANNAHHIMNNNNNVVFNSEEQQVTYMNGGPVVGQMNNSDLEHLMLR